MSARNSCQICLLTNNIYIYIYILFEDLNVKWKYVICKSEKRIGDNFPKAFEIPLEIDMLVQTKDVQPCADYIETELRQWFKKGYTTIRRSDAKDRVGVILYFCYKEILYFDIQTARQFSLSDEFNVKCIENRELSNNKSYYQCQPKYDLLIRATEYVKNEQKIWHKDYIREHVRDFDKEVYDYSFENSQDGMAKDVISLIDELK